MADIAAGAPMLAFRGVGLAYGDSWIVRHVDLTAERGAFIALLGPSGAGKSTLLRIAMGLIQPTEGEVRRPAPRPGSRPSALVFQDAKLLPWRRVRANVELGLEGLGLSRAERRDRAARALALVGLAAQAERWPGQLSGGQRQRIGVARALTVEPDLLLMDEPFGALDAITRAGLQEELLRIWEQTRKTVLFVTHDIDEAMILADRVLVLGGHPACVRGDVVVGPRPRTRTGRGAEQVAARLRALLAGTSGVSGPDFWRSPDI